MGLLGLGVAFLLNVDCSGFALLGPYEPWMQPSNSYRLAGDIGGPMPLGSGYRWNVPVISYGFDDSFMDYFGIEGSNAVVAAIQTINDLPPASALVLSNFPTRATRANYQAQAEGVMDLKSITMTLLLEQLGLTQPTRNVFVLRRWDQLLEEWPRQTEWFDWYYDWYIFRRNYDPESLVPSYYVNASLYTGTFLTTYYGAEILESRVDLVATPPTAIADWGIESGLYYTNYTRDDIGGLRYLLSSNNVAFEFLLAGISGTGTNASSWIDGALRSGIEKITLVPHPRDGTLGWLSLTNQFIDTFQTNGTYVQQELMRVTATPDILFSVTNSRSLVQRTDTANWMNNAAPNGNTNEAGPGLIRPPIKIVFQKRGATLGTQTIKPSWGWDFQNHTWGSFFGPYALTNVITTYPVASYSGINELQVNFGILIQSGKYVGPLTTWKLPIPFCDVAVFQRSTNLVDWDSYVAITNTGSIVDWYHVSFGNQEFFRFVPQ